ncbi:carbonic anhydrase [Lacticaseibacillus chiayiensis]|uniref:carbonic anhydrase n=1 Tax=Lacticaseibacillus chiayiensis TaxID=2100821 RepID=A0A4Q1TZJ0_9LACO|nr:carbonic anhydrase family protein [Lacticaseibacillus chiayiensis]QVI35226.1 carbonic anhydrase family protein [Lacticaseibacillus chiayiensis]RXT24596.1 carbonic anhydrase [Lacticaseibacillus chiayiensis]UYN57007.1 carbonic anhydrase family protein [Lacticaseibacillus chiayiensis]
MPPLDYRHQDAWPNGFGQQQSPLDLREATAVDPSALTIETPWLVDQEVDDQVTIRMTGKGRTRIDETQWFFVQAHLHVPAEHQTANRHAAEWHFVHRSAIGALCVVAVLVPLGAGTPLMDSVLDHFVAGSSQPVALQFNSLLPAKGTVYRYLGSLTTPPLTEGVTWYVIDQAEITISTHQLHRFQRLFPDNNRKLQARNNRPILCGSFFQKSK